MCSDKLTTEVMVSDKYFLEKLEKLLWYAEQFQLPGTSVALVEYFTDYLNLE